jgi:hypothetical protein
LICHMRRLSCEGATQDLASICNLLEISCNSSLMFVRAVVTAAL